MARLSRSFLMASKRAANIAPSVFDGDMIVVDFLLAVVVAVPKPPGVKPIPNKLSTKLSGSNYMQREREGDRERHKTTIEMRFCNC
jgi:hypothetical protein